MLFPIRLPTRSRFRGRSVHRGRSTDAQGKNTSGAADADDNTINALIVIFGHGGRTFQKKLLNVLLTCHWYLYYKFSD